MNTSDTSDRDTPNRPDHDKLLHEAVSDLASAARAAPPPAPDQLRARLAELGVEILEPIGRGGMGAVYRAVQHKLGRVVAVKVLSNPGGAAAATGFAARFAQEARVLARLNHPHILTIHDFGEVDGVCYLTTEFVDGINLRELMDLGQLSPAEALRITPQICQALHYAHQHGVVHRDVKPENILIDTEGQVKIADFGLAKLGPTAGAALTRGTEVFGTPQYMAPEQWRGSGDVDHRADIFSLGVVLYEMLTGQLPVGAFDPPSRRSGVPRGLDQVVQRSLAQRPENRYQSAREVETDVRREAQAPAGREAAHDPAGRDATHGEDRSAHRRPRQHRILIGCLVLAVLGAMGAGALFLLLAVSPPVPEHQGQMPEPHSPAAPTGEERGVAPSQLLGATPAEVLRRLGPPLAITAAVSQTSWTYPASDGRRVESALVFEGSVVISYERSVDLLVARPRPATGPFLGQRFEDVVRELGPPALHTVGPVTTSYEYDSGLTVSVKDGYVVGFAGK